MIRHIVFIATLFVAIAAIQVKFSGVLTCEFEGAKFNMTLVENDILSNDIIATQKEKALESPQKFEISGEITDESVFDHHFEFGLIITHDCNTQNKMVTSRINFTRVSINQADFEKNDLDYNLTNKGEAIPDILK